MRQYPVVALSDMERNRIQQLYAHLYRAMCKFCRKCISSSLLFQGSIFWTAIFELSLESLPTSDGVYESRPETGRLGIYCSSKVCRRLKRGKFGMMSSEGCTVGKVGFRIWSCYWPGMWIVWKGRKVCGCRW